MRVIIRDQVPNSSTDKVRVTIKENIKPVKILLIPTTNARSPEYFTLIPLNYHNTQNAIFNKNLSTLFQSIINLAKRQGIEGCC